MATTGTSSTATIARTTNISTAAATDTDEFRAATDTRNASNTTTWSSVSTTTGTVSDTTDRISANTTTDTLSKHQPNLDHNEEVCDDNEEEERGHNHYPLGQSDVMESDRDDQVPEYCTNVEYERPVLLEGASSVVIGGVKDYDELTQAGQTIFVVPNDYMEFINQPSITCNLSTFIKMVVMPIKRMEKMLDNNPVMVKVMDNCRSTLTSNDVSNLLLITLMMATMHPHPLKKIDNDDEIPLGYLSFEWVVRMILGTCGFIHGWKGPVSDIVRELLRSWRKLYICPCNWALPTDIDRCGLFCSDSSRFGSDVKSGPCGVNRNSIRVTELSDCSETSSCVENEKDNHNSRLNVFESGCPVDNNDFQSMKRFFSFLEYSNSQRRESRSVQRVRCKIREDYIHNYTNPSLCIIAKHNEKNTATMGRNKQNQNKRMEAHNRKIRKWQRDIYRLSVNNTPRNLEQVEKKEDLYPELGLRENPAFHFKKLRLVLRKQVSKKWLQFCDSGKNLEETNQMQFHCWMTPVRWIKQSGPK